MLEHTLKVQSTCLRKSEIAPPLSSEMTSVLVHVTTSSGRGCAPLPASKCSTNSSGVQMRRGAPKPCPRLASIERLQGIHARLYMIAHMFRQHFHAGLCACIGACVRVCMCLHTCARVPPCLCGLCACRGACMYAYVFCMCANKCVRARVPACAFVHACSQERGVCLPCFALGELADALVHGPDVLSLALLGV